MNDSCRSLGGNTNPLFSIDRLIGLIRATDSLDFEEEDFYRCDNQKLRASATTMAPSQLAYQEDDDFRDFHMPPLTNRLANTGLTEAVGNISEIQPQEPPADNLLMSFSSLCSLAREKSGRTDHRNSERNTRDQKYCLGIQEREKKREIDEMSSNSELVKMLESVKSIVADRNNKVAEDQNVVELMQTLKSFIKGSSSPRNSDQIEFFSKQLSKQSSNLSSSLQDFQVRNSLDGYSRSKFVNQVSQYQSNSFQPRLVQETHFPIVHDEKSAPKVEPPCLQSYRALNETLDGVYCRQAYDCQDEISILTNHGIVEKEYQAPADQSFERGAVSAHKLMTDTKNQSAFGLGDISSIKPSLNVSRASDLFAGETDFSFEYALLGTDQYNQVGHAFDIHSKGLFTIPEASCDDTLFAGGSMGGNSRLMTPQTDRSPQTLAMKGCDLDRRELDFRKIDAPMTIDETEYIIKTQESKTQELGAFKEQKYSQYSYSSWIDVNSRSSGDYGSKSHPFPSYLYSK